jgi:hypothetical protein
MGREGEKSGVNRNGLDNPGAETICLAVCPEGETDRQQKHDTPPSYGFIDLVKG